MQLQGLAQACSSQRRLVQGQRTSPSLTSVAPPPPSSPPRRIRDSWTHANGLWPPTSSHFPSKPLTPFNLFNRVLKSLLYRSPAILRLRPRAVAGGLRLASAPLPSASRARGRCGDLKVHAWLLIVRHLRPHRRTPCQSFAAIRPCVDFVFSPGAGKEDHWIEKNVAIGCPTQSHVAPSTGVHTQRFVSASGTYSAPSAHTLRTTSALARGIIPARHLCCEWSILVFLYQT